MSFKVIDGGGPSKEEAQRKKELEFAEADLRHAVREAAANILRIVRGAGKPYEVLNQFSSTIKAAVKLQDLNGYWPSDQIANALRLTRDHLNASTNAGELNRAHAIETIVRGSLQVAASQLVDQPLQISAGGSELHRGVDELERAREAIRNRIVPQGKKDEHVSAVQQRTLHMAVRVEPIKLPRSSSTKFGPAELKELRKAIKAKDEKRITELRALLGQSIMTDGK